jgi:hypothetical protein
MTTALEKFMQKVVMCPMSGCWLWTGAIKRNSKPCSQYGWATYKGKNYNAHRLSWILHNGPIESSKTLVCHHCDNTVCVNPSHLFLGTHTDNINDCVVKGRQVPCKTRGEQHNVAKLTEKQVLHVREMLAIGHTQYEIADAFGVGQTTISAIKRHIIWSHLHA